MGFFTSTRPSPVILALSFVGLIVPIAATKVVDIDVWWHLATGWVIASLQEIPRNDIFSYTAFGAPWLNQEWLFQLTSFLAYDAFGIAALTAIKVILTVGIAFIIFRTISMLTSSCGIALVGTATLLWAISTRVMERPFLLGLVFLAAFGLILHRYVRTGTRLIWLLPVIQVVWVNTHGGAILGFQLIFAFAIGETLCALTSKRVGGPPMIPAKRRRALWIAGLACVAACTINPWGIDALIFPVDHLKMHQILSWTEEWLPMLHPHLDSLLPLIFTLILFAAALLAISLNARSVRLSDLAAVAMMSMLLARSQRFAPDFLIIVLPIACKELATLARRLFGPALESNRAAWVGVAAVFAFSSMAMVRGLPVSADGSPLSDFGVGATSSSAPSRLIDFLEANDIRGRIFNEMGLGGYLIFRRWPKERVFIDGRTPIYGDEFYGKFVDAFRTGRNFTELDQRYNFDYIVFSGRDVWNQRFFHKYLWENPEWKLVYMSGEGIVYLRDIPRFRGLINRYGAKRNPLVEEIAKDEAGGINQERN